MDAVVDKVAEIAGAGGADSKVARWIE